MSTIFIKSVYRVLLLTLLLAVGNVLSKTYTRINAVRQLSDAEAAKQHNVELKGVITYSYSGKDMGFIYDGAAGIFFLLTQGQKPNLGDSVIATAKTGAGEFAPILMDTKIEVIGKGQLPPPAKSSNNDIFNGHEDSQWIAVNGIIKSVRYDDNLNSVLLQLDMAGRSIDVYVVEEKEQELPFHLLGASVYIEGVAGADFNQKRQLLGIRLFVQEMSQVRIIMPEAVNPFKKDPLRINQILQYSSSFDNNQRIRFQGIVTHQDQNKIYLADSTGSIIVYSYVNYDFEIGDKLDIVGFAVAGEFAPEIKNGLCKKLGRGDTPAYIQVDSLTSLVDISESALISLRANLLKTIHQKTNSILYLEKDSILFQAQIAKPKSTEVIDKYEPGSLLNLIGIAHLETGSANMERTESGVKIPGSVMLILRNPDDITLIQPPSWFTFEKAIGLLAGLGIMILLSFGWVYLLKRKVNQRTIELNQSNRDLLSSQKEKDVILQNVEEGFFLLDEGLIIQSEFSAALLDIMQTESPANKSFMEFLTPFLPEKEISTIIEFISLVLDHTVDEQLIRQLNPISRLAFHFKNSTNEIDVKYLTFEFKRVMKKDKINGLIVTVIDETEEFRLAEKLKESEEKSKKQLEWLTSVINLDPRIINEFLTTTDSEIKDMEEKLKTDDKNKYSEVLEHVGRSLHLLKGNATLLEFKFFAQQIHNLEDVISSVKVKTDLKRNDLSSLVTGILELKNDLAELKKLINKLAMLNVQTTDKTIMKDNTIVNYIRKMALSLSANLGKKIHFDSSGFQTEILPPQYLLVIKNVLIQLIRNSLAHGIETPQERQKISKPEDGLIRLTSEVEGGSFILKLYDDGRGLPLEKLKEKALESGAWNEKEINSWDKTALSEIIFKSGISSSNNAGMVSGRGVGMDLIRNQLEKHNGRIKVNFEEGSYCEFTIKLPLVNEN